MTDLYSIFWVGLVPIEEVLQVNHDLLPSLFEVLDALTNHSYIFFSRNLWVAKKGRRGTVIQKNTSQYPGGLHFEL